MKKTRRNEIPDFSPKPKGGVPSGKQNPQAKPAVQPKAPVVKPQSGTGQSGHRG
jgi:hypothetical protein